MYRINQTLLQLERAIALANSDIPQDKALAVILFDNLIEVMLYRKAENILMWDSTTWYGGSRSVDTKTRNSITGPSGKYDRMLKFIKDHKIITEQELETIKFTHEVRNAVYHRGENDHQKIELAILIYFALLTKSINKWSKVSMPGHISRPGYYYIDFTANPTEDHKKSTLTTPDYFEASLKTILAKWQIAKQLNLTAQKLIISQIEAIERRLAFIKKESAVVNFYGALKRFWYLNDLFGEYESENRKPQNLNSILLLCLYIRENSDYLDDLPNLNGRQKEGRRLLRMHGKKYKGKYPYQVNLDKIKERVRKLTGKEEHVIVKNIIDIQNKLMNQFLDVEMASSELGAYMQDLYDLWRGK